MKLLRFIFLTSVVFTVVCSAVAQQLPFVMEIPVEGVQWYDENIPKPEEIIGHEIGTRHTESLQALNYFKAVTDESDIAVMHEYARSHENRALVYAIVTSRENHERLDEIREQNVRLTTDASAVTDEEIEDMPLVIYMGYNVHGNEASSAEAAMLMLYHLTAGRGEGIEEMLKDMVVIIDPNMNPDGRDRFVNWVNMNRGGVHTTDRQDREHNEAWPGGRGNHYWFDLNRDYIPLAHPETKGKVETYQKWRPQVFSDFHETGRSNATHFFQPGIPERTHPLTPRLNQELTMSIAEYHADIHDKMSQTYWTGETYDDFYYGKGSTYPDVQGTVGILYEQRSSRSLEADMDNYPHGMLHYKRTVRNQTASSLSTLQGAWELRKDLLRYQRDFFGEAPKRYRDYETKAYVIDKSEYPNRAQAMVDNIRRHRVKVYELNQHFETREKTFKPGEAYIIPMNQPQNQFIRSMMETRKEFPSETSHDVSTWTMPLTFGVPYACMQEDPSRFLGSEVTQFGFEGGEFIGDPDTKIGYVLEWGSYFSPRALYRLQDAEVVTRMLHKPMSVPIGDDTYQLGRGSITIPFDQPNVSEKELRELIEKLPEMDYVRVFALEKGLFPEGPDFGSPSSQILEKPSIALLTGSGARSYNAGEVRHQLNERYKMPISQIDVDKANRANLDRYNVLVLAGGYYGALEAETVKDWVRQGGTVIGIESGAEWLNSNDLADLESYSLDLDQMYLDSSYADQRKLYYKQNIEGSIFEAQVDNTHPIGYGYDTTVPVLRKLNTFYGKNQERGTNVAVYNEKPLLSGYISEELHEMAEEKVSIVARREGRGRVVLMFDNPNFRSHWHGTNLLFANAVFFGQTF
ncbi:MAG: M14 family zinc carboxypeptidase [Bacteroidales bacterium]